MRKLYLLVVVIVICSMISGCGEKTAPVGYNPENISDYITSDTTSNNKEKVLSKQDIVDFFKNKYCQTKLSPINDTTYYSSDGNIELIISSTSVSYMNYESDIHIGFYFKGDVVCSDGQYLRIKVSDGIWNEKTSNVATVYNTFFELLEKNNIKYDFSQQQVDSSLSLTNSKFALKAYEYKHNNTAKFVLQERLDNQGNKIIGRDLYCNFYTEVLIK